MNKADLVEATSATSDIRQDTSHLASVEHEEYNKDMYPQGRHLTLHIGNAILKGTSGDLKPRLKTLASAIDRVD